ncbi:hypothetical protein [Fundidesulfovibrio soli]|uniref:hypothetical protein n=1 Tax=Fundidesulfovibrio soli TaxID=2922716 RepID=UPI001FB029F2|nr:hypothetical protein [Fundidesulfovibrio soli]
MSSETIALDYMMDNGLADDTPKTALGQFAQEEHGPGGLWVQPAGQQTGNSDSPVSGGQQDVGNGMSPFEREAREANPGYPPSYQTPAEREAREAGQRIHQEGMPPKVRPWAEVLPNGDVRFGDDTYLRWKPLPGAVSSFSGALIGSVTPGNLFSQWAAGYGAEDLINEHVRWPWLSYEPRKPDAQTKEGNTP